jgi:ubiquinone/menaquinone biosynthesis C-methylase UbiE
MSNPAVTYERSAVPFLFGPWASLLLETAAPRPADRVLDLACGTGVVARRAAAVMRGAEAATAPGAAPSGRVSALDMSANMLEVARAAAREEGVEVTRHEGRMESLPFPDRHFDLVLCQQGLQFVEERPRAMAEMHRVLDAGGRLALAVWQALDRHPFYAEFNRCIERHIGIPALAAPFALGDAADLATLAEGAGFERIVVESRWLDCREPGPEDFVASGIETITAAIPSVQGLTPEERGALTAAIESEMAPRVREHTDGNDVVLRFHAHLMTAQRPA